MSTRITELDLRAVEIAVLAILRAAAGTIDQVAQYFPDYEFAELQAMLDHLRERGLLTLDSVGQYPCTARGCGVLRANKVIVALAD